MADEAGAKVYSLTLDDGSVVRGTAEEIVQTVGKMKSDTHAALKQEREARESLQQQVNTLSEQQRRANLPAKQPGQFDNDNFYTKLNQNPADAVMDALAWKLGIPSDQLPGMFQELTKDVSSIKQQTISAAFWQRHASEFDPKYADVLTNKFGELVNQGYPADLRTLETGFRELVEEKKVTLLEPKKDETKEEPPPNLTGTGDTGIPTDEESKLYNMNMDDLEKVMREKGVLK